MLLNLSDVFVKSLKNKTVMIQIIIDDNKEVDIKATKGLEETELAANAAIEILRQYGQTEVSKTKLLLVWVSSEHKSRVVKAIKDVMEFDLIKAKEYVDESLRGRDVVLASGSREEMMNTCVKFHAYDDIVRVCT